MTDTQANESSNLATEFEGQLQQDSKDALKADLPSIESDMADAGNDMADDADKLGNDVLNLAKDIGNKVFADAKADVAQFLEKLPEPVGYLLQGMAGSAEAAIDAMGTQAYTHLQGEEKQMIEKTKAICGQALALVDAFFERASK